MGRKLGLHLESDGATFCLWQPSKWDNSKWRVQGIDQFVDSLCFRASYVSHANTWLTLRRQKLSGTRNRAVVAALYIYSSYSPFEDMVNRYMTDDVPITPITSMDQVNGLGNDSLVLLTNSTQYDRPMPVNFSVLHDVTLLDGP